MKFWVILFFACTVLFAQGSKNIIIDKTSEGGFKILSADGMLQLEFTSLNTDPKSLATLNQVFTDTPAITESDNHHILYGSLGMIIGGALSFLFFKQTYRHRIDRNKKLEEIGLSIITMINDQRAEFENLPEQRFKDDPEFFLNSSLYILNVVEQFSLYLKDRKPVLNHANDLVKSAESGSKQVYFKELDSLGNVIRDTIVVHKYHIENK